MEKPTTADQYTLDMSPEKANALSDCVFVAFDTETTGLSPLNCELVELSGVKFRGCGTEISTFSELINPMQPIPARVTAVHGITDAMVANSPTYKEVVPQFFKWLDEPTPSGSVAGSPQKPVLMAHNANFDIGFLDISIAKLNLPVPENRIIDTLSLSRKVLKDSPNHQLRTLTQHLGVSTDSYHRALDDSQHVRHVFMKLVERIVDCTIDLLLNMAGKLRFSNGASFDDRRALLERPVFHCIQEALDDDRSVMLQYSSATESTRVVTPRSVLFSRGTYYLQAFCHLTGGERTFRLDKISRMEIVSTD